MNFVLGIAPFHVSVVSALIIPLLTFTSHQTQDH